MWGHRFVNIVEYDTENCEYFIDYAEFETTEEVMKFFDIKITKINAIKIDHCLLLQVDTPLCSAQRFDGLCEKVRNHLSGRRNSTNA